MNGSSIVCVCISTVKNERYAHKFKGKHSQDAHMHTHALTSAHSLVEGGLGAGMDSRGELVEGEGT